MGTVNGEDSRNSAAPSCFGKLETVFPKGEDGLRHSPETCLSCPHKTECLRAAMAGEGGRKAREEVVDRAYASGTIGFFRRWSRKKLIQRGKKKAGGEPKKD